MADPRDLEALQAAVKESQQQDGSQSKIDALETRIKELERFIEGIRIEGGERAGNIFAFSGGTGSTGADRSAAVGTVRIRCSAEDDAGNVLGIQVVEVIGKVASI